MSCPLRWTNVANAVLFLRRFPLRWTDVANAVLYLRRFPLSRVQRSREFEKGRWKRDQISSRSWFIKAGRLFRLRLLQRSTWLALVAWDGRTAAVIEWSIQATNQQDPYFSSSTCKSFMPPKKIIHSFRWIENRFEKFMHKWHGSNDWGLSLTALDRVFATAEINSFKVQTNIMQTLTKKGDRTLHFKCRRLQQP